MADPTKTALDVVNDALGDVVDSAPADDVEDTEQTPEPEDGHQGSAEETESSDEGEAPADDATDEEAEERGYARDPATGKFVKKEKEPDDATSKKEQKLDKDGKPVVEKPKKAPDPINDPIPKELKQETKQRIHTLIETAKTATAERDKLKADFDYIVNGLQATGTTPEQYSETLSWLAMFNSNDPAQQRKALELVETVAERLSLVLGVDRQQNDPLNAHRDLVEAVQKGQIAPQFAREIARNRNAQQFRGQVQQTVTQSQQQEQQRQQELQNGRQALNNLEAQLKASDPQYQAKRDMLLPVLQPLFQKIPPSQWEAAFRDAYSKVQAPAVPRAKAPANQPLRANKNPAGGGVKGATSMRDAIEGALAGLK